MQLPWTVVTCLLKNVHDIDSTYGEVIYPEILVNTLQFKQIINLTVC